MKQNIIVALFGVIASAIITGSCILVFVLSGQLNPLRTIDAFSFSLAILGVVITVLTLLGSFTLINTWNDIDKRAKTIVEKYEADAKKEIERNATERQMAIETVGERVKTELTVFSKRAIRRDAQFTISMVILLAGFTIVHFWSVRSVREQRFKDGLTIKGK